MKSLDKLMTIQNKITTLNDSVLKFKKWKLSFDNRGANNYCLVIILNNEELFCGKFDTYGSVLGALELLEYMFSKALDELNKKEEN